MGNSYFRRFKANAEKLSPHIKFRRIKYGFYRIFWKQSYVHEIYKECPMIGYQFEIEDPSLESQKYYEELEDGNEITRKVKNYKEGYFDSLDHIRTRVWMLRHDKEFNQNAEQMYRQMVVK